MGDHYLKQLEDKAILVWDCLNPLAGFSLCDVSLKLPFLATYIVGASIGLWKDTTPGNGPGQEFMYLDMHDSTNIHVFKKWHF